MTRYTLLALAGLLIGLVFPIQGFAHGGGLNAEGCHNQRSNNSYHCHRTQAPAPVMQQEGSQGPYFATCADARAAGHSRIRRGEPGYASHLDRDNDGIACE